MRRKINVKQHKHEQNSIGRTKLLPRNFRFFFSFSTKRRRFPLLVRWGCVLDAIDWSLSIIHDNFRMRENEYNADRSALELTVQWSPSVIRFDAKWLSRRRQCIFNLATQNCRNWSEFRCSCSSIFVVALPNCAQEINSFRAKRTKTSQFDL